LIQFVLVLISFFGVAMAQNAWIGWLGPFAAAAGYALFWQAVSGTSPKQRFWTGFVWFFSVQAFQLSWMATTEYMGLGIIAVYLALAIGLGIQFGFLSWLIGPLQSLSILRCLALAGIWVLLEWIRLYVCTGFTWNPVGLALAACPYSLQTASLFGIFGLSFWVIFVNLVGLKAYFLRSFPVYAGWALCAVAPYVFGIIQYSTTAQDNRSLSVLLVQTALVPEQRDYDPKFPDRFIDPLEQWDRILGIIENTKAQNVDLIVLPEGAVPFNAYQCAYPLVDVERVWTDHFGLVSDNDFPTSGKEADYKGSLKRVSNAFWARALANHFQCDVVMGMNDWEPDSGKHFNAAFHFSPRGESASRVEKRILVPVGEYVPFKNWDWVAQFLSKQFGIGDSFDPGNEAKVFSGRVLMGVSICYEETFSEVIRHLRMNNAQLFINISNDVWFPHSRLAKQHFNHGVVRVVENGVPLIRACNTGITCGVDCFGNVLAQYPEDQAGALVLEVPLRSFRTLYSIIGDRAILILSAFFALCSFKMLARNK